MSRVCVYIDGFNLYYGLKTAGLKRHSWLDQRLHVLLRKPGTGARTYRAASLRYGDL